MSITFSIVSMEYLVPLYSNFFFGEHINRLYSISKVQRLFLNHSYFDLNFIQRSCRYPTHLTLLIVTVEFSGYILKVIKL